MICKQCAHAADSKFPSTPGHCNRSDCMCQHRKLNREEYLKEAK